MIWAWNWTGIILRDTNAVQWCLIKAGVHTGLGLMAASMIYMIDARGGCDPIQFVVETIAGLVAGVYFPLQVLPVWAQWLAHIIPHTYVLDGARRALYGAESVPPLPIHELTNLAPTSWASP